MTLLRDGWWATAADADSHKIDEDDQPLCGEKITGPWVVSPSNSGHHDRCQRAYRVCGMARAEKR